MSVLTVDRQVRNLPVDMTSFVGRRRELAEVKKSLSMARLVTLTGMGGVGKTRLALRVADELHRGFADGVCLVELAGLMDPALVGQTVAAALGFHDQSAGSFSALSDRLAKRRLLIVLDNCEHLLDACAVFADKLLRACSGVRILATSRQPLGITGEQTVPVPPLSVPEPNRPASMEGLNQYEAIGLFVDRAAAVHPGFAIDVGNEAAVAAICRRLDGIPLALELAAVRLRALSAEQLLARLDDRYGLLTGGSRSALPRQQTLRALIDWSFELCSPGEKLLWARSSVFVDGFDLDTAEEVCSDEHIPAHDVLDLLAGLVDKSIAVAAERRGRVRYQLPETIREYGRDRLVEFGQTVEFRRRERDWCERFVAAAASGWFGSDQPELFDRLRLEHGNIRSALDFCLAEAGESDVGLAIATALRFYWLTSGRLNEGRLWLDRLLARESSPSPTTLKGLYVAAYLAAGLSDFVAADRLMSDADLLAQRIDDTAGTAFLSQVRGFTALFRHHPADAATLLNRALQAHQDLGDVSAIAYDQAWLALALTMVGDHGRADALFEECLAATGSVGEHWVRSGALWARGIQACMQGDRVRATAAEQQSIRLRLPLDSRYLIGLNFDVLAWTAMADGDSERAGRLFGAAHAIMETVGSSLMASGPTSALHNEWKTAAREALGEAAFQHAFQVGFHLGFDQAVAYALGEREQPAAQAASAGRAADSLGSLTRREREIAELITRGLSNKEIASTLVISPRTAEGHVEHILSKLNFTNRVQIASWVTEQRVTPRPS